MFLIFLLFIYPSFIFSSIENTSLFSSNTYTLSPSSLVTSLLKSISTPVSTADYSQITTPILSQVHQHAQCKNDSTRRKKIEERIFTQLTCLSRSTLLYLLTHKVEGESFNLTDVFIQEYSIPLFRVFFDALLTFNQQGDTYPDLFIKALSQNRQPLLLSVRHANLDAPHVLNFFKEVFSKIPPSSLCRIINQNNTVRNENLLSFFFKHQKLNYLKAILSPECLYHLFSDNKGDHFIRKVSALVCSHKKGAPPFFQDPALQPNSLTFTINFLSFFFERAFILDCEELFKQNSNKKEAIDGQPKEAVSDIKKPLLLYIFNLKTKESQPLLFTLKDLNFLHLTLPLFSDTLFQRSLERLKKTPPITPLIQSMTDDDISELIHKHYIYYAIVRSHNSYLLSMLPLFDASDICEILKYKPSDNHKSSLFWLCQNNNSQVLSLLSQKLTADQFTLFLQSTDDFLIPLCTPDHRDIFNLLVNNFPNLCSSELIEKHYIYSAIVHNNTPYLLSILSLFSPSDICKILENKPSDNHKSSLFWLCQNDNFKILAFLSRKLTQDQFTLFLQSTDDFLIPLCTNYSRDVFNLLVQKSPNLCLMQWLLFSPRTKKQPYCAFELIFRKGYTPFLKTLKTKLNPDIPSLRLTQSERQNFISALQFGIKHKKTEAVTDFFNNNQPFIQFVFSQLSSQEIINLLSYENPETLINPFYLICSHNHMNVFRLTFKLLSTEDILHLFQQNESAFSCFVNNCYDSFLIDLLLSRKEGSSYSVWELIFKEGCIYLLDTITDRLKYNGLSNLLLKSQQQGKSISAFSLGVNSPHPEIVPIFFSEYPLLLVDFSTIYIQASQEDHQLYWVLSELIGTTSCLKGAFFIHRSDYRLSRFHKDVFFPLISPQLSDTLRTLFLHIYSTINDSEFTGDTLTFLHSQLSGLSPEDRFSLFSQGHPETCRTLFHQILTKLDFDSIFQFKESYLNEEQWSELLCQQSNINQDEDFSLLYLTSKKRHLPSSFSALHVVTLHNLHSFSFYLADFLPTDFLLNTLSIKNMTINPDSQYVNFLEFLVIRSKNSLFHSLLRRKEIFETNLSIGFFILKSKKYCLLNFFMQQAFQHALPSGQLFCQLLETKNKAGRSFKETISSSKYHNRQMRLYVDLKKETISKEFIQKNSSVLFFLLKTESYPILDFLIQQAFQQALPSGQLFVRLLETKDESGRTLKETISSSKYTSPLLNLCINQDSDTISNNLCPLTTLKENILSLHRPLFPSISSQLPFPVKSSA